MTESERTYSGTVVAAVIFTIMAAGLLYRYWPSDERSIRRHLSNLAEGLSIDGRGTEAAHMTRLAALREYFSPDVRIRADDREVVASRDALIGLLSRWTPPPGGVVVEFVDVQLAIAEDHRTASVTLTANVASTDAATGEQVLDTSPAAGEMAKIEGDWVITQVEARSSPRPR